MNYDEILNRLNKDYYIEYTVFQDSDTKELIVICYYPDAYENIPEPIETLKGMTIALCGDVKKDKFKNEKKLYSNARTKIYVLSSHKVKTTKFEEHFNKKL